VAEGHRAGEGDMNCMMCFPKLNSYRMGLDTTLELCYFISYKKMVP
jgi:hypothetical protein